LEKLKDEIKYESIRHYIKFDQDLLGWIDVDLANWLQFPDFPVYGPALQEKATLIEHRRDENQERSVWEKRIQPIVESHNLRSSYGERFEYVFLDSSGSFTELDIFKMKPRTSLCCEGLESDDFSKEILGRLYNGITQVRGKYTKIDIKDRFIKLLNEVFSDGTLPHFLEFLGREKAPIDESSTASTPEKEENDDDVQLEVQDTLRRARSEVEILYNTIREERFYSDQSSSHQIALLQDAATGTFDEQEDRFTMVKHHHLEDAKIYRLTTGKEKRGFIGALLQKIVQDETGQKIGRQKLYKQYQEIE
jgi:hypothetical protein